MDFFIENLGTEDEIKIKIKYKTFTILYKCHTTFYNIVKQQKKIVIFSKISVLICCPPAGIEKFMGLLRYQVLFLLFLFF